MPKSKAILIDITKCIGCLSCEAACKQLHGFSQDPEPKLSTTAFTIVEEHGDRYVRRMCMNCQDPACASACLVGALKEDRTGAGHLRIVEMHRVPLLSRGVPV
jgi:formate dehydrogenase iron-sulfur subunit